MRIPRDFIEKLTAGIAITDYLESQEGLQFKGQGDSKAALCPFHDDRNPSFSASDSKGSYICWACGAKGGDLIEFLMARHRLSFPQAVRRLARFAGLERELDLIVGEREPTEEERRELRRSKVLGRLASYFAFKLKQDEAAQAYLRERGIPEALQEEFQVGLAPCAAHRNYLAHALKDDLPPEPELLEMGLLSAADSGASFPRFRDRLMFPIRDPYGRVVGFAGRALKPEVTPKYLNSSFSKSSVLYGLSENRRAGRSNRCYLVEGYTDVIQAAHHGVAAAACCGVDASATQLEQLLSRYDEIGVLLDDDGAGRCGATRMIPGLLRALTPRHEVRFVSLCNGLDPDEWLRQANDPGGQLDASFAASPSVCELLLEGLPTNGSPEQRAQWLECTLDAVAKMTSDVLQGVVLAELAGRIGLPYSVLAEWTSRSKDASTDSHGGETIADSRFTRRAGAG